MILTFNYKVLTAQLPGWQGEGKLTEIALDTNQQGIFGLVTLSDLGRGRWQTTSEIFLRKLQMLVAAGVKTNSKG